MRSSAIRHPEGEKITILREWQVEACEGNRCAGLLLSFFEYWHNIKLEMSAKAAEDNDALEALGKQRTHDEGLNMYHTEEELSAAILGQYGVKTIREAVLFLETKNFLTSGPNPDVTKRFDRKKHYWFHPEVVNEWLDIHRPLRNPDNIRQNYRFESTSLPNDHPAKLPIRRGKIADSQAAKMPDASGKNADSYKETEITTEITNRERNNNVLAPVVLFGELTVENLVSVDQLPKDWRCPKTVPAEIHIAILRVCRPELSIAPTKIQAIKLGELGKAFTKAKTPPAKIYEFGNRWRESWQGKDGSYPTFHQMRENWSQMMSKGAETRQGGAINGISKLAEIQQQRRTGQADANPDRKAGSS